MLDDGQIGKDRHHGVITVGEEKDEARGL